jgi:hypothetical protein
MQSCGRDGSKSPSITKWRHARFTPNSSRAGRIGSGRNFNQSLVAVAASACTIEALCADVVYLISEQPKVRTTHGRIGQVIDAAFGLNAGQSSTRDQLRWLFERRNEAVHPYTELEPPRVHPAGLNSSAETAEFNAVESSRAVDIAMAMLELAAAPPNPHGRWMTRWVAEREPYHSTVIAPLRARRATGRPTQVQTTDTDKRASPDGQRRGYLDLPRPKVE